MNLKDLEERRSFMDYLKIIANHDPDKVHKPVHPVRAILSLAVSTAVVLFFLIMFIQMFSPQIVTLGVLLDALPALTHYLFIFTLLVVLMRKL